MPDINAFISAIGSHQELLTFNRGIEREALRVTPNGNLSEEPHPAFLGSKLTHPKITTDFSEAQLELITPVHQTPEAALKDLDDIHRFIYTGLDEDILWSASMPCVLQDDSSIPLAYYGGSNLGRLKTTYRNGLGIRYGRGMQTICAVHYNFSLSDALLDWLQKFEGDTGSRKEFATRRYFDLMRNFRRYSWLLTYLFGASPAVCNSFIRGREHNLQAFDEGTAYMPYATSLRSGGLGYQSDTQANHVKVCYNSLGNYIETLADAITTPYQAYAELGVERDGETLQVNDCILQSEAEFYSSIRAKCVPPKGKNFLQHLNDAGVQYIEVRLLDVNPYLPLGIDAETIRFIDTFLLWCLITDSPAHDDELCKEVGANTLTTVYEGRGSDVTLMDQGKTRYLNDWGTALLNEMAAVAQLLDDAGAEASSAHKVSLKMQLDRMADPGKTPSGQILNDLTSEGVPFFRLAMNQALSHRTHFKSRPLSEDELAHWQALAEQSVADQAAVDSEPQVPFSDYLKAINQDYLALRSGK